MITIKRKADCCGCNACVVVCPKKSITMETDNEGFWYPKVNLDTCVDCGLCENVCPIIEKDKNIVRYETPRVFAAYNKDHEVRIDSTSGGIFSALATKLFNEGGYVGGAVYNPDHSVSHIVTNDVTQLPLLRSSKYLQSYTENTFPTIKNLLNKGEKVAFCATPCQIQALYKFLGKDYDNLVTIDFICRGVNSPLVFKSYMKMLEDKYNSPATKIKFKAKQWGWHNFSMRVNFANGKEYCKDRSHDLFFIGYLQQGNFARPSCYDCRFKGFPQKSDITLADFWGIEKIDKTMDQDCGTSLVLINSDKGLHLFEKIQPAIVSSEFTMEDAKGGNPAMVIPLKSVKANRDDFFKAIHEYPFDLVAKKFFILPSWKTGLKRKLHPLKRVYSVLSSLGVSPQAWWIFLYYNFLNSKVNRKKVIGLCNRKNCRIELQKGSKLILNDVLRMGITQVRGSQAETRLLLEKGARLIVNGPFSCYANSYIRVAPGGLLILNKGFINENVQITAGATVSIGRDCAIGRDVVIRSYDGHTILEDGYEISKDIKIGDHVWIGQGATILKGVTIGDGAIVASGAIVTKDIPAHCIVAGIPAKVVREGVEWR